MMDNASGGMLETALIQGDFATGYLFRGRVLQVCGGAAPSPRPLTP
jgi:hypothetical protein